MFRACMQAPPPDYGRRRVVCYCSIVPVVCSTFQCRRFLCALQVVCSPESARPETGRNLQSTSFCCLFCDKAAGWRLLNQVGNESFHLRALFARLCCARNASCRLAVVRSSASITGGKLQQLHRTRCRGVLPSVAMRGSVGQSYGGRE